MWRNLLMSFANVKTCHIPDLLVLRELDCVLSSTTGNQYQSITAGLLDTRSSSPITVRSSQAQGLKRVSSYPHAPSRSFETLTGEKSDCVPHDSGTETQSEGKECAQVQNMYACT